MAVSRNKTRVQITLTDEVATRLNELCERTGMTKSSFINYTVAMALDSYNGVLEKMARAFVEGDKE